MLTFKTLKKTVKNLLVTLPLHVSVHSFDHPQWAHIPYFVLLLDWFRWFAFFDCLCSIWLYVLTVSLCVCVCV